MTTYVDMLRDESVADAMACAAMVAKYSLILRVQPRGLVWAVTVSGVDCDGKQRELEYVPSTPSSMTAAMRAAAQIFRTQMGL